MKKSLCAKTYLLAFSLLITLLVSAQEERCTFIPDTSLLDLNKYSNRFNTIVDSGEKYIFDVKFHAVYGTNGENPHNITEEKILNMVAYLNIHYNQFNIFFKYRGYDFFKDSQYLTIGQNGLTMQGFKNKIIQLGYYNSNMINIFLPDGASSEFQKDAFVASSRPIPNLYNTCSHEVGHVLGLLDLECGAFATEYYYDNVPYCIYPTIPVLQRITKPAYNFDFESITRNPLDPYYNADIKGDLVTDTKSCFYGFIRNFDFDIAGCNPDHYNEDPRITDFAAPAGKNCYYCFETQTKYCYVPNDTFYTTENNNIINQVPLGNSTWQNFVNNTLNNCSNSGAGEVYSDLSNELHNIMGVGGVDVKYFSNGQGTRMRETILASSALQQKLNRLDDNTPDISVLYEPFAFGTSNNSNPPSGTAYSKTMTPNETNTGVNVWNCGPFLARFQPGFNYEFSTPSGQITTQIPTQQYNALCNGYIGVKIPTLSQDIIQTMEPMCFSSFEPYIKGEVKSLDYLGSIYITTEILDSIKATNPDLYNELQSGKYHIVIKETESGYVDQKLIYKN